MLAQEIGNMKDVGEGSLQENSQQSKSSTNDITEDYGGNRNIQISLNSGFIQDNNEYLDSLVKSKQNHVCEFCGKRYETLGFLNCHLVNIHNRGKTRKHCEICKKEFPNSYHFTNHKCIHTEEGPYECGECDNTFKTKVLMKKHQDNFHSDATTNKPHKSDLCDNAFFVKSSLKQHKLNIHKVPPVSKQSATEYVVKTEDDNLDTGLILECETVEDGSHDTKNLAKKLHSDNSKHFSCEFCDKEYKNKSHVKRHVLHAHKDGKTKFCCHVCNITFRDSFELQRHITVHSDKRPHKCDMCDKSFKSACNVKRHQKAIHTINHTVTNYSKKTKLHKCGICHIETTHITRHMRIHTDVKRFKCGICHRKFKENHQLKRHVEKNSCFKHGNSGITHICKTCGSHFNKSRAYQRHRRMKHAKEFCYKCDLCGKMFLYRGILVQHKFRLHGISISERVMKNHKLRKVTSQNDANVPTLAKPKTKTRNKAMDNISNSVTSDNINYDNMRCFTCYFCDESFVSLSILKKHLHLFHSGLDYYKCDLCNSAFHNKGTLKRHILAHSTDQPFKCDLCSMTFKGAYHLKLHVKMVHLCGTCGKYFKSKGHLQKHVNMVHTCRTESTLPSSKSVICRAKSKYKCWKCNMLFSSSSLYMQHQRKVHSETFKHRCDICGIKFLRKVSVLVHQRYRHGTLQKPGIINCDIDKPIDSLSVGKTEIKNQNSLYAKYNLKKCSVVCEVVSQELLLQYVNHHVKEEVICERIQHPNDVILSSRPEEYSDVGIMKDEHGEQEKLVFHDIGIARSLVVPSQSTHKCVETGAHCPAEYGNIKEEPTTGTFCQVEHGNAQEKSITGTRYQAEHGINEFKKEHTTIGDGSSMVLSDDKNFDCYCNSRLSENDYHSEYGMTYESVSNGGGNSSLMASPSRKKFDDINDYCYPVKVVYDSPAGQHII